MKIFPFEKKTSHQFYSDFFYKDIGSIDLQNFKMSSFDSKDGNAFFPLEQTDPSHLFYYSVSIYFVTCVKFKELKIDNVINKIFL